MYIQEELNIKKTSSELFYILKTISDCVFSHEEFTYGLTQKITIRIPCIKEVCATIDTNITKFINSLDWAYCDEYADFIDMPYYELPPVPKNIECEKCDSDGEIECPSCDGEGTIELNHDFQDKNGEWQNKSYECQCDYCDGFGKIQCECENKPFIKKPIPIKIGCVYFNAWDLELLKVFKNVKIIIRKNLQSDCSLLVKFNEGNALLKPLKE